MVRATSSSIARIGTWFLPHVVFVFSGLMKLARPVGFPPGGLVSLADHVPYSVILRVVGAGEVVAALLLLNPRTRGASSRALLVMIVLFSLLIAVHSYDSRFINNCGCFGGIVVSLGAGISDYFGVLLLRNAFLGGILLLGILSQGSDGTLSRRTLNRAALAASGFFLLTLLIGEATYRIAVQRDMSALASSQRTSGMLGKPFPEVLLVDNEGQKKMSVSLLRAGDHLIFFSTSCSQCRALGRAWRDYDLELRRIGSRLILVTNEDAASVLRFMNSSGCSALDYVLLRDRRDWLGLGVTTVPHLIVLNEVGRICVNERFGQISSFRTSLELCERQIPGFESDVLRQISKGMFGENTERAIPYRAPGGALVMEIRGADSAARWVAIVAGAVTPADYVEFAVGLETDGTVHDFVPLSYGSYARAVDPDLRLLNELRGYTLTQATDHALQQSRANTMEADVWRSIELALSTIPDLHRD